MLLNPQLRKLCLQTVGGRLRPSISPPPSTIPIVPPAPAISEYDIDALDSTDPFSSSVDSVEANFPNDETVDIPGQEVKISAPSTSLLKSGGCAPRRPVRNLLLKHLHAEKPLRTVSLFNFHDAGPAMAKSLLSDQISDEILLVESSHAHARQAKLDAKKRNDENVTALRAQLSMVLGTNRKKHGRFAHHILGRSPAQPFVLDGNEVLEHQDSNHSALVSVLPSREEQMKHLQMLLNSLLLHYAKSTNTTIFKFGTVELVTFLDIVNLVHCFCGVHPSLSFCVPSHRRFSEVMHKLFHIRQIGQVSGSSSDSLECTDLIKEGVPRRSFNPVIPRDKNVITHQKKLLELNFSIDHVFPVSIRPRRFVTIDDIRVLSDLESGGLDQSSLSREIIPDYAAFMFAVGKHSKLKKTEVMLRELCPESAEGVRDCVGDAKMVGELSAIALERLFLAIREEFVRTDTRKKFILGLTST